MLKRILFLILIAITWEFSLSPGFAQNIVWEAVPLQCTISFADLACTSQGKIFGVTDLMGNNSIMLFDDIENRWIQCNNGFPSDPNEIGTSIAVNSQDILFVTTGPYLYRSDNLGVSWEVLDPPGYLQTLYVDSDDVLYAGANGDVIYRSNDNGLSWNEISVYTPDKIRIDSVGNIFVLFGGEVLVSYDAGASFDEVLVMDGMALTDILIDSSDNIYVSGILGVYKSEDHGQSYYPMPQFPYDPNSWITTLAKDQSDNIFAGGFYDSVLLLENGSEYTQRLDDGLCIGGISKILSRTEGELFVATINVGMYHTTNLGVDWEQVNDGFNSSFPSSIFYINDYVFAGVTREVGNDGLFRSSDSGNEWTHSEHDGSTYYYMVEKNEQLFIATSSEMMGMQFPKLHRSDDDGCSWTQIGMGLPWMQVESIANNSLGEMFAVADFTLYISYDNGDNWEILPNQPISDLRTVLITPNDYIYLGGDSGKVHRSTDNGLSWESYSTTIAPDYIDEHLTLGQNGILLAAANMHNSLSRSSDFGQTWQDLDIDFEVPILSVKYDHMGHLYVTSMTSGVFVSEDNGDSWINLNSNLPTTEILKLAVKDEDEIFITTQYGHIYHGALNWGPVHIEDDVNHNPPPKLALGQNFPNPFNVSTAIPFSLSVPSKVSLKVYSVSGQLVKTLVNETLPAGYHEINWMGTSDMGYNVPAGIYINTLETDGHLINSTKLVITR